MTTRRPGIHAVERGAVVILTLMTPELETALDDGHAITYAAESINDATGAGWRASVSGPAEIVVDPVLRARYRRILGFELVHGVHILRLQPKMVEGHRFQRLSAAR